LDRYLGWWGSFGSLPQKGVTSYSISSNRQRPLAGTAYAAVFNSWRRFKGAVLYVAPPFVFYYFLMDWAEKRFVSGYPAEHRRSGTEADYFWR
jgi:ubiquinol-cytochrome c reductase subunit 8